MLEKYIQGENTVFALFPPPPNETWSILGCKVRRSPLWSSKNFRFEIDINCGVHMAEDNFPGPSSSSQSLFQTIIDGELTDEQWETFKEMQKRAKNLVDDDNYSDFSSDGEDDGEGSQLVEMQSLQLDENAGNTSDADDKRTQELTTKYINGELSFSEFAHLADDDEDDRPEKALSIQMNDKGEVERLEKEYEEELQHYKNKGRRKGRRTGRLPRDLHGLMGEAHLCFARGDHEDAIKMCMEVIRIVPTAPEPFQTLGMIYEEMGNLEKALQYSLIAAFLNPNDPEEWVKLAVMALEQNDTKVAITCYSKAIKYLPDNVELLRARCELYEKVGDKKRYLESLYQIFRCIQPIGGAQLEVAKKIVKIHYDNGQIDQALSTMTTAYFNNTDHVSFEDTNLLFELLIYMKVYSKVVEVLCTQYQLSFDDKMPTFPGSEEERQEDVKQIVSQSKKCTIPDILPIDLQIKLAVSLIHLEGSHVAKGLLTALENESPELVGDLYLDVSEAYMDVGLFQDALPLLKNLVLTENYNLPAVWLKYGECLHMTGDIENAVEAFQQVTRQAPYHPGARLTLSGMLQQLGKSEEALDALRQQNEGRCEGEVDVQLLYTRCNLLYARGKWEEFIVVARLLLCSEFMWLTSAQDLSAIAHIQGKRTRMEFVKDLQNSRGKCAMEYVNPVSVEQLREIFEKSCYKLYELKRFDDLVEFTYSSLTCPSFMKRDQEEGLFWLCLLASYFGKRHAHTHNFIRDLILKNMGCNQVWNLFAQNIILGETMRHNKFCLRLILKNQDRLPLCVINGHNALVSGTYKHALGEYMTALKLAPQDPLLPLCIGLTYIHLLCQKFTTKKSTLVVQAVAFLERYVEIRGECQESFYNMGRAMHQLNMLHIALHYYKKALACPPPFNDDVYDLKREIAFNMASIYQKSGSNHLARMYIEKYCVI